ncbi:MAG: hypothetical protein J3K34DRAFT_398336 [Monoraphidium minutum]|nr:MAG: hypothetical protein J3K34DRAFT_398336 [Monoraphidium minutum]
MCVFIAGLTRCGGSEARRLQGMLPLQPRPVPNAARALPGFTSTQTLFFQAKKPTESSIPLNQPLCLISSPAQRPAPLDPRPPAEQHVFPALPDPFDRLAARQRARRGPRSAAGQRARGQHVGPRRAGRARGAGRRPGQAGAAGRRLPRGQLPQPRRPVRVPPRLWPPLQQRVLLQVPQGRDAVRRVHKPRRRRHGVRAPPLPAPAAPCGAVPAAPCCVAAQKRNQQRRAGRRCRRTARAVNLAPRHQTREAHDFGPLTCRARATPACGPARPLPPRQNRPAPRLPRPPRLRGAPAQPRDGKRATSWLSCSPPPPLHAHSLKGPNHARIPPPLPCGSCGGSALEAARRRRAPPAHFIRGRARRPPPAHPTAILPPVSDSIAHALTRTLLQSRRGKARPRGSTLASPVSLAPRGRPAAPRMARRHAAAKLRRVARGSDPRRARRPSEIT